MNIGNLKIERKENKVVFSLDTDPKKFAKILAIIYLVIFGYLNISIIIPSWIDGKAPLWVVLFANFIFVGISLLFVLFSPTLLKFAGKNVHKTTDFIVLDKNNNTLYFRNEDISFNTKSIKDIKLDENKSAFGLAYYLTVVTDEMEKRMMPPMHFKFAIQIKDVLKQEMSI